MIHPSKPRSLAVLALCLAAAGGRITLQDSPRGKPRLMQGPMLGAVGPDSAVVWARLSGPFEARVVYERETSPSLTSRTALVAAHKDDDYVIRLALSGLTPATRYRYTVFVAGAADPYLAPAMPFTFETAPAEGARGVVRVAFGSCARFQEDRTQPIWLEVLRREPHLFLWLGDNIYGDALDPDVLAEEYRRQRDLATIVPLLRRVPQLAIWDDHDFGLNDHDRRHPAKAAALAVFRRYWANPAYGTPEVPGVFFAHRHGGIDFFFLDCRYHRDPNEAPDGPGKTMLGQGQLAWLQAQLVASRAPFKVLVSSSGWSKAKGPGGDSWAAFLHERDALFDFITAKGIEGVVLLSGDTHVSELNAIPWSEKGGYDFYDIVSSPLAQDCATSWLNRQPEVRVRPVYSGGPSFGLLEFDLTDEPRLRYVAYDARGGAVCKPFELRAAELRNGVSSWQSKVLPRN